MSSRSEERVNLVEGSVPSALHRHLRQPPDRGRVSRETFRAALAIVTVGVVKALNATTRYRIATVVHQPIDVVVATATHTHAARLIRTTVPKQQDKQVKF